MHEPILLLLIGLIVVGAMLLRGICERIHIPPVVGYLVIGFGLRLADAEWALFQDGSREVLSALADLGLITLLFHVGLESNLQGLIKRLPEAVGVWIVNVLVTSVGAFAVTYWVLDAGLVPSLFVGTALSATSVGISVAVWEDAGRLETPLGELLLDVAELDDISAILMMIIVLAVAPILALGTGTEDALPVLGATLLRVLTMAVIFAAGCVLFSRYLEPPITGFFASLDRRFEPILPVAGIGVTVAAFSGLLGFSVAVGALFAGLVFSRNPRAVRMDAAFSPIFRLLSPFFFIYVAYGLDPDVLGPSVGLGLILSAVVLVGKMVGSGLPLLRPRGWAAALTLGASMIPPAEIALLVMQSGRRLGDWAVPDVIFGAIVIVCAITSVIGPLILQPLLNRYPPSAEDVA